MYLAKLKEQLRTAEFSEVNRKEIYSAFQALHMYAVFDEIQESAAALVVAYASNEGVTKEELLVSSAKYRAVTQLIAEMKALLENTQL